MTEEIRAAHFKLQINGTELKEELYPAVDRVSVEEELNLPAMFTFRLSTEDFAEGEWRGVDLKEYKPGDEVKITMGEEETDPLMSGEVTALEPTFGPPSYMDVRGYDRMHRLRFGRHRRSFSDMKDSDIVSSLASDAGLSADAADTGNAPPVLFQNNESNYAFLLRRARRIGYEMSVDGKKLVFRKSGEKQDAEFTLEHRVDLRRFSARLRIPTEGSEVEVRGWDVAKKEVISFKASAGDEISKMGGDKTGFQLSKDAFGASPTAVVDDDVADDTAAETVAKARYNTLLCPFIAAEGKSAGNPKIRPGKVVQIKGVGDKFSGPYYVEYVVHSVSRDEGYVTRFRARRTGL